MSDRKYDIEIENEDQVHITINSLFTDTDEIFAALETRSDAVTHRNFERIMAGNIDDDKFDDPDEKRIEIETIPVHDSVDDVTGVDSTEED